MNEKISHSAAPSDQDVSPDAINYSEDVKNSKADIGRVFLAQYGTVEYTTEEEKAVKRKIDWYILPIVSDFDTKTEN